MTQSPPILTDRAALDRHRQRMRETGSDPFLQTWAAEEVIDRLKMVNKSFKSPAIVTPFPDVWQSGLPDAHIVEDRETLKINENTHDLVVHALGLHWSNDPVGQIIQCRRALKPDGLFLCVTLGGTTLHELRHSLSTAEVEVTGGLSPRVVPMADVRDLGALLQRAGLALPVADTIAITTTYETPFHLFRDLRAMGENNALASRLKHATRKSVLMRAASVYKTQYGTADGRIPATFDFVVLTGWAPDASQPKPLRPGSATTRLADALGGIEAPLRD